MQLIQINVIRLQPFQRMLDGITDIFLVEACALAVGPEPVEAAAPDNLAGKNDLIAPAALLEPGTDNRLGRTLRLGFGRNGIEFGRIDEIDTEIHGVIKLLVAFGLRILLAPSHRAETDRGDVDTRPAKFAFFEHDKGGYTMCCRVRPSAGHKFSAGAKSAIERDWPDNIPIPRLGPMDNEIQNHLIESCKSLPPLRAAIAHPVTSHVIQSVADAAKEKLITPILIGPEARIRQAAAEAKIDISAWQLIATEHSHAAATKAVDLAASNQVDAIIKGSLHTDELMHAVVMSSSLRTAYRISHAYLMETSFYHKPFIVTDAAINIAPDLDVKMDIVQNAINLWHVLFGNAQNPKVALLAAVETVNSKMQATLDAAALCKMADRRQITGGILDGPLALDNAINRDAAKEKEIISPVAGDADILVAPNIESANILAKELTFLGNAQAAGIILGVRVPVILTSRADSLRARLLSCALAVKMVQARREGRLK